MSAQRPPEWEPEPLRLPVEPPTRRAPPMTDDEDAPPARSEREGSHVIVIDIA
jgi:hypothetical protein